jgi:hypothetical protein
VANPGVNRILVSDNTSTGATARTNLTFDDFSLSLGSSGSTASVLTVYGSAGQLFQVNDGLSGDLMQVSDISGLPIFTVNSNGALYLNSSNLVGLTASTTILSIVKTSGSAAYFDYRVSNLSTGAFRAGTVTGVWDGTNATYVDRSTPDLNASTLGVSFTVTISSSNVVLTAVITTGTWNVKVGARFI